MTLTPEEIESLRIAIAEECGWKWKVCKYHSMESWHSPEGICTVNVPPYTTSLDSIREAAMERFKLMSERLLFDNTLKALATCYLCELTALDWSIAFARTAKIWRFA